MQLKSSSWSLFAFWLLLFRSKSTCNLFGILNVVERKESCGSTCSHVSKCRGALILKVQFWERFFGLSQFSFQLEDLDQTISTVVKTSEVSTFAQFSGQQTYLYYTRVIWSSPCGSCTLIHALVVSINISEKYNRAEPDQNKVKQGMQVRWPLSMDK